MLVNIGSVLGLTSVLIAIGNDNAVCNKVAAEIWEHADIFLKQKTIGFSLVGTKTFESYTN